MRLSKASAYAVFAAVYIAKHQDEGPVQGRLIAQTHNLPLEYLLKILQQLVRAGVLVSETGRRGGFQLKRPPQRTTLLEIVEAIDGPVNGHLTMRAEISGAEKAKDRVEALCERIAEDTKTLLRQATLKHLMLPE
jgi:Rrf2 family protein